MKIPKITEYRILLNTFYLKEQQNTLREFLIELWKKMAV